MEPTVITPGIAVSSEPGAVRIRAGYDVWLTAQDAIRLHAALIDHAHVAYPELFLPPMPQVRGAVSISAPAALTVSAARVMGRGGEVLVHAGLPSGSVWLGLNPDQAEQLAADLNLHAKVVRAEDP